MKDIDNILKENINANIAPSTSLNSKLLECAKENSLMEKGKYKIKIAVASMVGILALGSVSAYASYRFLTPAQVAEVLSESSDLSKAFESEDSVIINETQNINGYNITLMGTVKGQALEAYAKELDGISNSKTYAVVAIENEDGSAMPDQAEVYCLTPLIRGKSFSEVSVGALNGGVSAFVQDGIQYELLECDDLEIFADMGVELGVIKDYRDGFEAFNYDEKTGNYSRNENYEGLNALFELPLDKSKADNEAAEEFFTSLTEESTSEDNASKDSDTAKDSENNDLVYCKEVDYLLNLTSEDAALSSEKIDKLISLGTVLVDKDFEEENGKFHVSWSNDFGSVDEVDDTSLYKAGQPTLYFDSVADGENEGEYSMTAEYFCMENGVLTVKQISYNWEQVKEIYKILK